MALKVEKEPKQRSVMFSKESVVNDKFGKLTSFIGRLATQATQNIHSRPFKSRVYQGRGRPLSNFERGDLNYNDRNGNYRCNKPHFIACNTFRDSRKVTGVKLNPVIR